MSPAELAHDGAGTLLPLVRLSVYASSRPLRRPCAALRFGRPVFLSLTKCSRPRARGVGSALLGPIRRHRMLRGLGPVSVKSWAALVRPCGFLCRFCGLGAGPSAPVRRLARTDRAQVVPDGAGTLLPLARRSVYASGRPSRRPCAALRFGRPVVPSLTKFLRPRVRGAGSALLGRIRRPRLLRGLGPVPFGESFARPGASPWVPLSVLRPWRRAFRVGPSSRSDVPRAVGPRRSRHALPLVRRALAASGRPMRRPCAALRIGRPVVWVPYEVLRDRSFVAGPLLGLTEPSVRPLARRMGPRRLRGAPPKTVTTRIQRRRGRRLRAAAGGLGREGGRQPGGACGTGCDGRRRTAPTGPHRRPARCGSTADEVRGYVRQPAGWPLCAVFFYPSISDRNGNSVPAVVEVYDDELIINILKAGIE